MAHKRNISPFETGPSGIRIPSCFTAPPDSMNIGMVLEIFKRYSPRFPAKEMDSRRRPFSQLKKKNPLDIRAKIGYNNPGIDRLPMYPLNP